MRSLSSTDIRWLCLLSTAGLTAIVIAFGRFRSNERIATAIATGVARRRSEHEAAPLPH
jgi:hypothetical protein